jgi:phosphoribosyl 1,2-cyclic phosphodiesterase
MNFSVLGSGSKGNAIFIESGSTSLLIDAGFSGKEIRRRLALIDRSPQDINAILISHEHGDHIGGAGVLSRQLSLPVYANNGTHQAAEKRLGHVHKRTEFETGTNFTVNGFTIHPFRICHDTADPVGFVVSDGIHALCCCTDTGRVTGLIRQWARKCQALVLEANYDPQMLADGPYPPAIQQRVRSGQGHLANGEAARFLAELAETSSLQQVVLAHLSRVNNRPELVYNRIQEEIVPSQTDFSMSIAMQEQPTQLFRL